MAVKKVKLKKSTTATKPTKESRIQPSLLSNPSDDIALDSWFESLGDLGSFQVKLLRKSPTSYKGVQVAGHCETYDEFIDEDRIRDEHGGGSYQIQVMAKNERGQWQYRKGITIKIPGLPKIAHLNYEADDEDEDEDRPVSPLFSPREEPGIARVALDSMRHQLDKAQSPEMVGVFLEPLREQIKGQNAQIAALQRELSEKDVRIAEIINRPPDRSGHEFAERLIQTESTRLEAVRLTHDSEIRQLREAHQQEIKAIYSQMERQRDAHQQDLNYTRQQFDRQLDDLKKNHDMLVNSTQSSHVNDKNNTSYRIDDLKRSHEQYIETLRGQHNQYVESLKVNFETRTESLKDQLKIKESDFEVRMAEKEDKIKELKKDLELLKEKKEKTPIEAAQELVQMHVQMKELGLAKESEKDDSSMLERFVNTIIENPTAIRQMITGSGGSGPDEPEEEPTANPLDSIPVNTPFAAQDGKTYIKTPSNQIVPYVPRQKQLKRKKPAIVQKAPETPSAPSSVAPSTPPVPPSAPVSPPAPKFDFDINDDKIQILIRFLESAFNNKVEQSKVVESITNMLPLETISYIKENGIEEAISKLPITSCLVSQAGKNWLRSIADRLQ